MEEGQLETLCTHTHTHTHTHTPQTHKLYFRRKWTDLLYQGWVQFVHLSTGRGGGWAFSKPGRASEGPH